MNKNWFGAFVGALMFLPLFGWGGVAIYNHIIFNREVGGHLKRAADANSIEMARQELETAIAGMEKWKMTDGYTSILYTTPDEDVGFWYKNVKTCIAQINELPPNANQGEKDLVLMKLRQTLLDHSGGHEVVTMPSGIDAFPYNTGMAAWGWISALVACVGFFVIIVSVHD